MAWGKKMQGKVFFLHIIYCSPIWKLLGMLAPGTIAMEGGEANGEHLNSFNSDKVSRDPYGRPLREKSLTELEDYDDDGHIKRTGKCHVAAVAIRGLDVFNVPTLCSP